MTSKSAIIAALHKLSAGDLDDVQRNIDAIKALGAQGTSKRGAAATDLWLLQGIYTEMEKRGLRKACTPEHIFMRAQDGKTFAKLALPQQQALEDAVPNMNALEKRGLGILAARALAQYIDRFATVSFSSMTRNVARTVEAVGQSYPGYLEGGVMRFVLRTDEGKFLKDKDDEPALRDR